eukprot:7827928-Pyramimonas_sp.AAC.1
MVQVLAQQQKLNRNEGDNENALQAETTRIRAGNLDVSDDGPTGYARVPGDRLSLAQIEGIGRS